MSEYSEYFLKSNSNIVELELIEIHHPDFSETYRIVRNNTEGVTVTLEDSNQYFFQYVPMRIEQNTSRDNLDWSINITFGDLGEIIPSEIDNVFASGNFETAPTLTYRVFRSDVLTQAIYGPFYLEIITLNFNENGVTFEAKAPQLSNKKTGIVYSIKNFPMLEGFI